MTSIPIPSTNKLIMKGTNILLGIIAVILAMFLGLQIEEQYRDVRYLNNCIKDIKANGIKSDDHKAYCAGLVRQDPYLFTFNKGLVAKYLQQDTSSKQKEPEPKK
ncbi:MAG: hypothetical protein VW229_05220 [Pelagibacteraceae bacterium]